MQIVRLMVFRCFALVDSQTSSTCDMFFLKRSALSKREDTVELGC